MHYCITVDVHLRVVPELPPEVLGPGDELPATVVVHEAAQLLLHEVLDLGGKKDLTISLSDLREDVVSKHLLGASLVEGVDELSALLEVGQLVHKAPVRRIVGGHHGVQHGTWVERLSLRHDLAHL